MEDNTAVIRHGNEPKAQVQIIDGQNGRRVQLYNLNGVMLCEIPFHGDNDAGFAVGNALFIGYMSGWDNCQFAIEKAVYGAVREASGGMKL